MPTTQKPGTSFTFPCNHRAILPALGISSRYAYWCKNPQYARKGTWRCGICMRQQIHLRQKGLGADGLIGWATILLRSLRYHAETGKYTAPHVSVQQLVELRLRSSKCALTDKPLDWEATRLPHLHHNHETGEVIGFVCEHANKAEGMLSKLTRRERQSLIHRAFPNEFDFDTKAE